MTTLGGFALISDGDAHTLAEDKNFDSEMLAMLMVALAGTCMAASVGITVLFDCGVWERCRGKRSGLGHKKGGVRVVPIGGGVQAWDQPSHHEFETMKKEKLALEQKIKELEKNRRETGEVRNFAN